MAVRGVLKNKNTDSNQFDSNQFNFDLNANSEHEIRHNKNSDRNLWNSFEEQPVDKNSGSSAESEKKLQSIFRIIKFIVAVLTFILILGTSVLSKLTFLFMTSQILKDTEVQYCDINQPEKNLISVIPDSQRIAWIWAIIFAYATPELLTFLRSARICFFKSVARPKNVDFLIPFIFETLHSIGLAIFAVIILPNLDVIQGAMIMNCVCFVPSVLGLCSRIGQPTQMKSVGFLIDGFAILGQLSALILWPIVFDKKELSYIPLALVLISCHWWDNFVSVKGRSGLIEWLAEVKQNLKSSHYYNHMILSPWKILIFSLSMILMSQYDFVDFFVDFLEGWGQHVIHVNQTQFSLNATDNFPGISSDIIDVEIEEVSAGSLVIMWFLLAHILSSYFAYIFSEFACKIRVQTFSFAFSVHLTIPMCVSILLVLCGLRADNPCYFHNGIPDYLFFNGPPVFNFLDYLVDEWIWISVIWLFSQMWVTRHVWYPKAEQNAATEHLFVIPYYESLVIDQSLALNRRRDDNEIKLKDLSDLQNQKQYPGQLAVDSENPIDKIAKDYHTNYNFHPDDSIPKLKICATMWHEEYEEMVTFLKSIVRLDMDQCAHRMARSIRDDENIDNYYELETHIFFDDAFLNINAEKWLKENDCVYPGNEPLNDYVKELIGCVNDAALDVYKTDMHIKLPIKYKTPYGGRLHWTLPGQTNLFVHLKNKKKIKAKKRWSQVMYMYYLLGYQIMHEDISDERKFEKAENTFILALDGDIDFQPVAVHLLLSRMRTYDNVGAACGRIHPTGNGPMVWYQKFEYAIGHWLQKATEHIIGCVLCSPGCFSLFRGSALMSKNVMKKYTAISKEAKDYVQYDQGEDRWLCTLLLKQKYRVEYIAASDSYTHAPEGFNEFFNQRRRWIPSTMANIIDLLNDAKNIVKSNDSISMPYIFYQSLLIVGTILGPGTIFLMMIGSLVAVFRINIWTSFLWNFIPLVLFMVICYVSKQDTQLLFATFLSAVYGLVMMAVLIGVVVQMLEDGFQAPTSIFFLLVAFQIIITGLLHPQELGCLVCGIVYYVTIPSMYLLLVIYSVFNMNDNTWGTRETKPDADATNSPGTAGGPTTSTVQQSKGPLDFLKTKTEQTGAIDFSFAGLFRLMLFTQPKVDVNQANFAHLTEQLRDIKHMLKAGELKKGDEENPQPEFDPEFHEIQPLETIPNNDPHQFTKTTKKLPPPDWKDDAILEKATLATIGHKEETFWRDLIEEYLKPDDDIKAKIVAKDRAEKLDRLRDLSVFAFVMLNAMFVVVILLMQLNSDMIFIRWPWGMKDYILFNEGTNEITISREYLQLEPIGMLFIVFFGIILMVQFIAMLMHRIGTFTQILSSVDLNFYCGKNVREITPESDLNLNAVEFARVLQHPEISGVDEEADELAASNQNPVAMRRNTIMKYLNKQEENDWSNLEKNFERRLKDLKANRKKLHKKLPSVRRETINLFVKREKSIMENSRRLTTLNNSVHFAPKNVGNGGIPVSLIGDSQPFQARSSFSGMESDPETPTMRFRPGRRSTVHQPISELDVV